MSSFKFSWASWVALLGLAICGVTAQERRVYRINSGQVPVARQLNPVLQSTSVERSMPQKVFAIQNAIDVEVPKPYEFGYQMNDGNGTTQHRQEVRRENGDIEGSYGYADAAGVYRKVEYYTDINGYHAKVTSNEPGLSNKNSANTIFIVENPPAATNYVPEPLVIIPRRQVA